MISSPLPDLDALDMEALKALVIAQHSELEQHRSNAQEILPWNVLASLRTDSSQAA